MLTTVLLCSAAVAALASVTDVRVTRELLRDNRAQDDLFEDWKLEFEKTYKDEKEHAIRRKVFKKNLMVMHKLNEEARSYNSSALYGVGPFADMHKEEFHSQILMSKKIPSPTREETIKIRDAHARETRNGANPQKLDYRQHGLVTRVKNQGQCGSCWAFSATEEIESKFLQAGHGNVHTLALAPQQIVDCTTTAYGCGGGETGLAYDYVMQAGGLVANATIPYRAQNEPCPSSKVNAQTIVAKISGYKDAATWFDETSLENNLVSTGGPISICVDAANWQHYKSGVMDRYQCAIINQLDHCVQLVGYDRTQATPYWIIRNSWTPQWGINGYIHVEMEWNACGVTNNAQYVVIA